jgi:hypothetical protein
MFRLLGGEGHASFARFDSGGEGIQRVPISDCAISAADRPASDNSVPGALMAATQAREVAG